MAVLTKQQLRRVYGRDERRCRDCWEARIPVATALRYCLCCRDRRDRRQP